MIDVTTILPVLFLAIVAILILLKRKQRSLSYLACLAAFSVYLMFVLQKTLFPLRLFDHEFVAAMQAAGSGWANEGLNLIPFYGLPGTYWLSVQGYGNVLLTIPFGFGLPFVMPTTFVQVVRRGLYFTLSIELAQLFINVAVGYAHRVADINDVILNLVGTLIGFACFRLMSMMYTKVAGNISTVRVLEHPHSVLLGRPSR